MLLIDFALRVWLSNVMRMRVRWKLKVKNSKGGVWVRKFGDYMRYGASSENLYDLEFISVHVMMWRGMGVAWFIMFTIGQGVV